MRPRDNQKSAFYAFEVLFYQRFGITEGEYQYDLAELQDLADRICRSYQVPTVALINARKTSGHSCYSGHNKTITLASDQRNHGTLLHEVAHHLIRQKYNYAVESHGPEYASCWAELHARHYDLDIQAIHMLMRACRVKFQ